MKKSLLHLCGHNSSWNLESLVGDEVGDGLIISPVHSNMGSVVKISAKVRKRSLFDPQYYLPNSQKNKLNTYPFFPEKLLGGFSTANFPQFAQESANRCVQFQLDQDFAGIVIPARYFSQMFPDYREKQETYTVAPFLNKIRATGKKGKPVYLTVPLTSHMLEHRGYRTDILNWVTSFPEIDGVYLIVELERQTKQIQSGGFLNEYLQFVDDLNQADLHVIAAYLNTEALLVSALTEASVTFGAFENTRMFSVDKFLTTDEERRGPKPRIYLPGLLNWVQYDQAIEIRRNLQSVWNSVYRRTEYAERTFAAVVDPHFSKPELYKHFFICFEAQYRELEKLNKSGRIRRLREIVDLASDQYRRIQAAGITLDPHGSGGHLEAWRGVLSAL